jgi:ubiquinone/menaquinone biosynthesis C-methylase UbiE/DNA-binding transcriptional ArsR family regulator
MAEFSSILKALGEETRLRILRLISSQELSVNELVEALGLPQPRISRHLSVLRQAGLAEDRREGNRVFYRMSLGEIGPFAQAVWQAVQSHQANGEPFRGDQERLKAVLAKRRARSKAYFDTVVSEWDRIKRDYIQDALPFLVAANLVRADSVAVEVGTGTGEVLVALARTGARVIGVDSSEKMLQACRQRVQASGLRSVELRVGDAEALPVADGECDTALSSMLLHHLADPGKGVAELARVVRAGGKVVIVDLAKHDQEWAREVMADVWLGFTERQIRGWLARAGLAEVTYSSSAIASPAKGGAAEKLQTFVAVAAKPPG